MKQRLILIYDLNKIDKELADIESMRGDLPTEIEELSGKKEEKETQLSEVAEELRVVESSEANLVTENESLTQRIDKNDIILRSGGVKSNVEYNALAREIDDAYLKLESNETILKKEIRVKKSDLEVKREELQKELDELNRTLKEKQEELAAVTAQTEQDEKELRKQREELLSRMDTEDIDFYERVNSSKFGDAVAIVRKGSCLGCYNSIPPQRVIEIKAGHRFFNCESCGRILIAEETVNR